MTPSRLLLVGMMGAGKTTVGRIVADRLGWAHLDSDTEVETAAGCSVPELFARDGEAAFRAAEADALQRVVAGPDPVVVSVGGGAVLDPANRRLLRAAGTVVWLRATPATLAGRVGEGEGRPLLDGDPVGVLARLECERRACYEEVAHAVVDVDALDPEAAAAAVGDLVPA